MFVEAVVSAYEGATWVADLDLFYLFRIGVQGIRPNSPFMYLPTIAPTTPKTKWILRASNAKRQLTIGMNTLTGL